MRHAFALLCALIVDASLVGAGSVRAQIPYCFPQQQLLHQPRNQSRLRLAMRPYFVVITSRERCVCHLPFLYLDIQTHFLGNFQFLPRLNLNLLN
jgi:hypothetical protein